MGRFFVGDETQRLLRLLVSAFERLAVLPESFWVLLLDERRALAVEVP